MPAPFADRLADAMEFTRSIACVGLDPVIEKLPAVAREGRADVDAIEHFCDGVLHAVAGLVPVVKFQSACFERYGAPGVARLQTLVTLARQLGLLVILDAKRGDIGVTAEHYAHAAFHAVGADCLTVNPYLGPDTLAPYLAVGGPSKGLFVLVRTSNPGSDAIQNLPLVDGRTLAEAMGKVVASIGRKSLGNNGLSSIGAVVGATKVADAARLRQAMPDQVFLIPGYGAQGGTADDIRPMLRPAGGGFASHGVLVTASRSVIYPSATIAPDASWTDRVRLSAENLNRELTQILT
ncbi:MAG TPA: orotidine-5'-phosphate decarboxylase [Phycisphaerales bacterium]|nr:orotidine-5'-phosphate decarboxylase [Phycisphaerales bacterium]